MEKIDYEVGEHCTDVQCEAYLFNFTFTIYCDRSALGNLLLRQDNTAGIPLLEFKLAALGCLLVDKPTTITHFDIPSSYTPPSLFDVRCSMQVGGGFLSTQGEQRIKVHATSGIQS